MVSEGGQQRREIEGYPLERVLSEGEGTGVYLVYDEMAKRYPALKRCEALAPEKLGHVERLFEGAGAAANLSHPNVVTVYVVGGDPQLGHCYATMEYASGGTVADLIKKEGRLPLEQALDIGIQACTALEYVHRKKVVHGNIKPSNILLFRDNGQTVAKVADFGPPREAADGRDDLYSLGAVLYEMLVGKPPSGDITPPRELRPAVFSELNELILTALAKAPSERFQDAKAMLNDLQEARKLCEEYHNQAEKLYNQGVRYQEQGKWKEAIKAFKEAYSLAPEMRDVEQRLENARLQLELERLWHEMEELWTGEDWDGVLAQLERIRAIDPTYREREVRKRTEDAQSELRLASLYRDVQDARARELTQQAIDLCRQILNINPRYEDVARILDDLRKEEKLEELQKQGEELVRQKKWGEAARIYGQVLDQKPDDPGAARQHAYAQRWLDLDRRYIEARTEYEAGRLDRSIEILQDIISSGLNHEEAKALHADALRRRRMEQLREKAERAIENRQWAEAEKALAELLPLDPDDEWVKQQLERVEQWRKFEDTYWRAKRDYEAGQWDEAVVKFEKALEVAKSADLDLYNYQDIRLLLADARKHQQLDTLRKQGEQFETDGNLPALIQVQIQMLALDPDNQEIREWKKSTMNKINLQDLYDDASSRMRQEDWPGAHRALEEIAKIDPKYKGVQQKLNQVAMNQDVKFAQRTRLARRWVFLLVIASGILSVVFAFKLITEEGPPLSILSLAVTKEFLGPVVSVFGLIVSIIGLFISREKLYELLEKQKRFRAYIVLVVSIVVAFLLTLLLMRLLYEVRVSVSERELCNGSFEEGWNCWKKGGDLRQTRDCSTGQCFVVLGSPDYLCEGGVPVGEAWIKQSFQVPQTVSPTLSLRYRVFSYDLDSQDFFQVSINGKPVGQFGNTEWAESSCNRDVWDSGWQTKEFDLSPYSGDRVQVSLHNVNGTDGGWNTWTYVDDVEIR